MFNLKLPMTEFEPRTSGVEATTLSTEPQPIPNLLLVIICDKLQTILWTLFSQGHQGPFKVYFYPMQQMILKSFLFRIE